MSRATNVVARIRFELLAMFDTANLLDRLQSRVEQAFRPALKSHA